MLRTAAKCIIQPRNFVKINNSNSKNFIQRSYHFLHRQHGHSTNNMQMGATPRIAQRLSTFRQSRNGSNQFLPLAGVTFFAGITFLPLAGVIFVGVTSLFGYDYMIFDDERLALFERYLDRDENAAQVIHKYLLKGDRKFIFDLCKSIVDDWDMKDKMGSVEVVHGGKSGSKIYKVQRKKIASNVTTPGNVVLSPDIVCMRIDVVPNDETIKLLLPGTFNHVGYMAHTRMRDSQYFPDFHTHPESHKIDLLPDSAVLEYLHGKNFWSRGAGTCPVFDTKEDAAAYGRALGMLHATTNEQWYEKCTNNRNPFHELKNKLSPRMIKAVENHSRSDEAVLLYRVAQIHNLQHICEILPEVIESLSPNSLMGRVVVAHNDLHDGNILRRHENDEPGDVVLVDFGRCCLMQAGHDLGGYLATRDGSKPGKTRWPTLENRRACAQAYIDATPADVLAKYTRTSVDEVVYDMEVGQLLRDAFIAFCRRKQDASKWIVNDRMKKILAITRKGLKEKPIEEKILQIGARRAANDQEWKEYYDANSGKNYYYNKTTRTTQWEKPSGVVFR